MEVSRSAYYAWTKRRPSRRTLGDQAILRELVRLHQLYPTLGLDSLFSIIAPSLSCSRKRVWRLMKQANIRSIRRKAYKRTTNSNHKNPVAPNLLMRDFSASVPNKIWVSDITYIPTGEGWLYLAIVKDLFTKKVVGYAFSSRIDTALTLEALRIAVRRPGGLQVPTEHVPHADPYDNAVAENFFSCLKCECVHLTSFATRGAAASAVFRYIEAFYNTVRPHSGVG